MKEPDFRCGTIDAIQKISKELGLPYSKEMQDWSYEVAEFKEIHNYLLFYDQEFDEDKRFVLMELIIQATTDQPSDLLFNKYWTKVRSRLITDFKIHEYTIYYWSCFSEELDDLWRITPVMRELWEEIKSGEF